MQRLLTGSVFAAALVMAPLGAQAADLVVWWEKGFYPQEDEAVAEIIAAFEQESGKQVELVQHAPGRDGRPGSRAALEAGQAARFLVHHLGDAGAAQWAYEDRLVDLEATLGPSWTCSMPTPSKRPRCSTAGRAGAACTRCRWAGIPTTFMSGTACWSGPASPSPTFPRSGRPSGLSGATRCSRRCVRLWAATTSGVSGCRCPAAIDTDERSSSSSSSPTRRPGSTATAGCRSTIPEIRAGMIKALEAYTLIWRKGCTPPDATNWTNVDNNKAFLAQTVVMTANPTLSIPAALRTTRPDDYYKNAATIDWPDGANGQPLVIDGGVSARRGLQGRQAIRRSPRTSSASSPRRAGSPTGWTSPATDCCRRCASWSSSRSGSTRATRTACARRSRS